MSTHHYGRAVTTTALYKRTRLCIYPLPLFIFLPFLLHEIATTMAAYRCRDNCRELRKELNIMAGIYKPPIRLAILDLYAGQTGDFFEAEIAAIYANALPLAKVGLPQFLYFLPIFCGDRASAPYRYPVG